MKRLFIIFLILGIAISQVSTEHVYVWSVMNNRFTLVELTGLTREGNILTIKPTDSYKSGVGINFVRSEGQPTVISVDTASFYMWVPPPTGPGECKSSTPISDQKILSIDTKGILYVCVPDENKIGHWGRTPLEFTW
jgi:hypothetical protein